MLAWSRFCSVQSVFTDSQYCISVVLNNLMPGLGLILYLSVVLKNLMPGLGLIHYLCGLEAGIVLTHDSAKIQKKYQRFVNADTKNKKSYCKF